MGRKSLTELNGLAYEEGAQWLAHHFPECAGGLLFNAPLEERQALTPLAGQVWECFLKKAKNDLGYVQRGLEALAQTSFDFIRLQARFRKTGRYRRSESAAIVREVYHNQTVMEGSYLDGLFLTYAFWPHHVRMLKFYLERFLPALTPGARIAEIGVGHGLMALLLFQHTSPGAYTAIDISPFSLAYTQALLTAHQLAPLSLKYLEADIMHASLADQAQLICAPMQAVLCCEVLEHVHDPDQLLAQIDGWLAHHGLVFVTTCANMEAEDHIYRFESPQHIRSLLAGRFQLMEELTLELKLGSQPEQYPPYNYAAILRKPV